MTRIVNMLAAALTTFLGSTTSADAAPPVCNLGTLVPNVGSYVTATPGKNALIGPDQCLKSANGKATAHMQLDGNFVVSSSDPSAKQFNTATDGYGGAGLLVQADGHFVVYQAGGYGPTPDGNINGDPNQARRAIPQQANAVGPYFLILEDDSVLRLYAGSHPANHTQMIWESSSAQFAARFFCYRILNQMGEPVGNPIDLTADSPTIGFKLATDLFAANRKGGASFDFSRGKCDGSIPVPLPQ